MSCPAIPEDACYYGWADDMRPYITANKPVFAAEYTDLPGDFQAFCRQSKALGFSTILKRSTNIEVALSLFIHCYNLILKHAISQF